MALEGIRASILEHGLWAYFTIGEDLPYIGIDPVVLDGIVSPVVVDGMAMAVEPLGGHGGSTATEYITGG